MSRSPKQRSWLRDLRRRRAVKNRRNLRPRLETLEDRRLLAVITVNSLLDNFDPASPAMDGKITLREAMLAANSDAAVGDAPAGSGADTVDFAVNGKIEIGSQLPTITGSLAIIGPGAEALTIDAGGGIDGSIGNGDGFRIFENSGTAEISGLTLTGGDTPFFGGAIINADGDLTVSRSVITGNHAEFANVGGGGIVSLGNAGSTLTVTDSFIFGNTTAGSGAGIHLRQNSTATITGSTISDNVADLDGGGIAQRGNSLTLVNSTISGNTAAAGGGIFTGYSAALDVNSSTIVENTNGGIRATDPVQLSNTIVAFNSNGDLQQATGLGTFSGTHNLIEDGNDFGLTGTISGDPKIGPLTDNGGLTPTHALLIDSPAINVGSSTALVDQRGAPFVRDDGGGVDIGAYERQQIANSLFYTVTTSTDELDYTNSAVSLREAIKTANGSVGPNTITFLAGLDGQQIDLSLGELEITDTLSIDASALTDGIIIDAHQQSRVLHFSSSTGDLTLDRLTLTGGQSTSGAGIYFRSHDDLTLANSTISGNTGQGIGAYDYVSSVENESVISLVNSTVSGNTDDGVWVYNNQLRIHNSTISGNGGGGVYSLLLSDVTIDNSTVTNNSGSSGGLDINPIALGSLTLRNSIVAGNAPGLDLSLGPSTTVTASHSLIGDNTGTGLTEAPVGSPDGNGNLIGQPIGSGGSGIIDPLLDPLADNGGPTLTHALRLGSPALNAGQLVTSVIPLPSTGVDASGMALGDNSPDAHYQLVSQPSGGTLTAETVPADGFPIPPWLANSSTSRWIGPNTPDAGGPGGDYVYRHTFNVPGIDVQHADFQLSGQWASDNVGTNILLNGNSTGLTNAEFNVWRDITIPNDDWYTASGNQLDFVVNNTFAGPTGLRVRDLELTATSLADQRGLPRNMFGGVDMGAFELQTVPAGSLVVDTTLDENDGVYSAGNLSLREAIELANLSAGADSISFGPLFNSVQMIELFTQLPTITDALTITGPGADLLTIDAGGGATANPGDGFRIFNIDDGTSGQIAVAISGLSLTGGDPNSADELGDGGAIRNREDLTVTNSTISGNIAVGNGGGIATDGTALILNTTVSGNLAGYGGGVASDGPTTITNSTISGNSAPGAGGGIVSIDALVINNSTISGNSGGGVSSLNPSTHLTIDNSTVTGNTGPLGGVYIEISAALTLRNSIVAGNSTGADLKIVGTPTLTIEHSLIGDNTGTGLVEAPVGSPDGNGNLIGQPGGSGIIDPLLAPLADNGGPTLTHALSPGSPATNAGDPAISGGTDQRGEDRVQLGRVDIGAFELQTTFPAQGLIVSTTSDVIDGDFNAGELSLPEALAIANDLAGADTITFSSLFATAQTINIGSQLPTVTDAVTIAGPGASLLTIDAGGGTDHVVGNGDGYRIFSIDDGDNGNQIAVAISGLTLTGGDPASNDESGEGGAIRSREDLTLSEVTVTGNAAVSFGGGIRNRGDLLVRDSTISGNRAAFNGGGIFNSDGNLQVDQSTISGNEADGYSGGIANSSGSVTTISGSTITNNRADADGNGSGSAGGIGIASSSIPVTLHNTIVAGNFVGSGTNASDLDSNNPVQSSSSYNLIGDAGSATGLVDGVNGNIVGVGGAGVIDPLLSPLADNGGSTLTHALQAGSPAINAGDPATSGGTDQRGEHRVQLGRVDIGAVERQTSLPSQGLIVSTTTDVIDGDFTSGELSLREAIAIANDLAGNDSITFSSLFATPQTINIASQLPTITDALTITGPGAGLLTIDAGGGATANPGDGYRLLRIDDGNAAQIDVQISGVTLTGGDPMVDNTFINTSFGGAIRNFENLTLTSSNLSGNIADFGGAIWNTGAVTVSDSALSGNTANGWGGGIWNIGTMTVTNSNVSGNTATIGGGISNLATATVTRSTLSGNSASERGGAIHNEASLTFFGTLTLADSTLSGNAATIGGGIHNGAFIGLTSNFAIATVTSSTLYGNSASPTSGGGIFNSGTANVTNTIIASSTSGGDLFVGGSGTLNGAFNLIEDGSGGLTDTISGDPMLGSLADNGGPTLTHAPLSGSPAIDAGDPSLVFDPQVFDQRGTPYVRVFGAATDIGAVETQLADYGDAPDDYQTSLDVSSNPARHWLVAGGPTLGATVDPEPDGQPTPGADGDDTDAVYPSSGDDEDGVTFTAPLLDGLIATIEVDGGAIGGVLNAWIDFAGDGDFAIGPDQIFSNVSIGPGPNTLGFPIPSQLISSPIDTYARFRITSTTGIGGENPSGLALNGEVEDYSVTIEPNYDFGDAPDNYQTSFASGNFPARHFLVPGGPTLGPSVDREPDGQPTAGADGDDNDAVYTSGGDDEDGVTFSEPLLDGLFGTIEVDGGATGGVLNAWIDFFADGDFTSGPDQIFSDLSIGPGVNTLYFPIPQANLTSSMTTYARFRITSTSGIGGENPNGLALNGEVEDYAVTIEPNYDFGDAPDDYQTTWGAGNPPRHFLIPNGPRLGATVDREPDGQPAPGADGDDNDALFTSSGDDEDGVTFITPLISDRAAAIEVDGGDVGGVLNAWIDFVGDGTFDVSDQIIVDVSIGPGVNILNFPVASISPSGLLTTYARFRITSSTGTGGDQPFGFADDGEVEDYQVTIAPDFDYGDLPDQSIDLSYFYENSDPARHFLGNGGPTLGATVDPEPANQPTIVADGDDADGGFPIVIDDEDGVSFNSPLVDGGVGSIEVDGGASGGILNAWIDFGGLGGFFVGTDHILINQPINPGLNTLTFAIPDQGLFLPRETYARFRITSSTGMGGDQPFGTAIDGEVEDYAVTIESTAVADIGGPYTGDEGSLISLSGSASTLASIYEWDLDNDGEYDDAFGEDTFFFDTDDNGVFTIGLRINGVGGPTDSTTVTVNNVAPTANVSGPASGVPFQPRTFTLTATDVSPIDQAADFTFDIDWDGDSVVDQSIVGPSGIQIDHAFPAVGNHTVRVTATDKDGGISSESIHPINIVRVELQGGDLLWGGTTGEDTVEFEETAAETVQIRITLLDGTVVSDTQTFAGITGRVIAFGGDEADTIDAGGLDGLTTISATLIGGRGDDMITGGDAADIIRGDAEGDGSEGRDTIYGGGGDDLIYGDGVEGSDDTIYGGAGNDTVYGDNGDISADGAEGHDVIYGDDGDDMLYGGRRNDTVFGGEGDDTIDGEVGNDIVSGGIGNDTLSGGAGKDVLFGGAGADILYGGAGEDLLLAGMTSFDSSEADLKLIGREWRSSRTYAERIANITDTPGGTPEPANAPVFLQPGVTVLDDAEVDTLFGEGETDWFLSSLTGLITDIVADFAPGEVETDIA